MDMKTIYSKTGKGVLEIKNKAGKLARDLLKVLSLIDGKSNVAEIIAKSKLSDAEMDRALLQLSAGGFIKEFSNTSGSAPSAPLESSYVDDLDFTSSLSPGKNPYQSAQTEFRQRESADRVKAEQEARKKREEGDRLKKEQALRQARDEAARLAKVEAERKTKEAAALKMREEMERKAKIEAEAMAQTQRDLGKILEAERRALEQTDRKKQQETEREARENAERRNRDDAERQRRDGDEGRRRDEEERRYREESERKHKEEEERKRGEEEARKRREEEERNRKEEEERKRREEEERKRRDEEERRQREFEERKRKEEEERRRLEEEERRKREEAELRRRREEEERRQHREEEDRRREEEERKRKDEVRARSEAAAKSDLPEFDLSGLKSMESQIASEFEKQQEELRRREEEEERRDREQEEVRRATERAEREEEARLEAERREAEDRERRERMERERQDREERERKRQEEKDLRIKEQEERRIKSEQERQRQEEAKVETARKAREEDLSRRRKEQEEHDRKRAEVKSLKKQKAIRTPLERFAPLIIGVIAVVAVVVGGIQLLPMNTYIPSIEKIASDHIGEPVTIGSMRVSVLGGMSMSLDNVRVGTTQDVKIDKVELLLDLGSVFGEIKVIRSINVESASVAQEVLPRLPNWMDAALTDKNVQVRRIVLKSVKLDSSAVKLPNFDAELELSPEGVIERAALDTVDGKLSVKITPRGAEFDIDVTAGKGWVPPVGPQIEFTDFSATAVASGNQIRVSEFRALLYGGAAKGSALINFGGPWSIVGQLTSERITLQELMPVFTKDAKSSGQLEVALQYSTTARDLVAIFDAPKIDGTFVIRKGNLDGVDLVRALQMGGRQNVQGGATRFEEISGALGVAAGRYQYRNLRLASGLLSATGGFEVFPSKDVTGRVYVELRSQAAQIRGNFIIDGNLKAVVLKPN